MESKKQFAKSILLGQRIFLNSQAMLNNISRNIGGKSLLKDTQAKNKFKDSLKDLDKCLKELEEITSIEMKEAKARLELCLKKINEGDVSSLHNNLQKLYRDDFLEKIVTLSK